MSSTRNSLPRPTTKTLGQTFEPKTPISFFLNPCILSLLRLKLHGQAFLRAISSVAPTRGAWLRTHYSWVIEEKKPSTQRDLNPRPHFTRHVLYRYNCCPPVWLLYSRVSLEPSLISFIFRTQTFQVYSLELLSLSSVSYWWQTWAWPR